LDTVLIIDDEPKILKILKNLFEQEGFNVIVTQNGESALEYLFSHDINVIVTDLKMPEMSGMEILKRAKEISDEVQVIIITAYGDVQEKVRAMKSGAFDFIQKPFQMDTILSLVRNASHSSKLMKKNKRLNSESLFRRSSSCNFDKSTELQSTKSP